MKLTASQRAAIEFEGGHLQLIACAGSGKTEVVAQRIARLLDPARTDRVAPSAIVAFTFTDRAAAELEARVHRRVSERYGAVQGMAELFIGTIHSFCRQLLQQEVAEFLRWTVLDGAAQRMLVAREPVQSGFALATTLDGQPLDLDRDISKYLSAIDVLRQGEVDRTQLGDCTIGAALERYRALLERECLLDYTGQLEFALDLIRRDVEVGSRLAARVRHIIVDEYQDTNPLQERVVWSLAEVSGAHICAVGDDDQTVYGFNGADIENILTFEQRYRRLGPVTSVRLEENFRSSDAIVEVARSVASRIDRRLPKAMVATSAQPFVDGDLACKAFRSRWDEARAIARKILALRESAFIDGPGERGLSWSDFAVLFRGALHYHANELIKVFDEEKIPFVVTGRRGLLATAECLALRMTMARFAHPAAVSGEVVRTAWLESELVSSSTQIDAMLRALDACASDTSCVSLQHVLLRTLDAATVRERGADDLRFANVGRFSSLLAQFERVFAQVALGERAAAFVAYCERSEREHEEASGVSEQRTPDAVRISTVHAAKGLQWPCVFVPRVEEGAFPSAYREPSQWAIVPRHVVRSSDRYDSREPEERRLFYVALTRAQRFLFVSAAGQRNERARPSHFYREFAESPRSSETLDRALRAGERRAAQPRSAAIEQRLTFSELKPLFECPYRFALQSRHGFRAPQHPAEGFGASLHNALAEVHRRAFEVEALPPSLAPSLTERHLSLPFADDATLQKYREIMERMLARYLRTQREALAEVSLVEKTIRVHVDEGISVEGRIDLVLRREDGRASLIDLKSSHRAQAETLSHTQLLLYALGYDELVGAAPASIEVWEVDSLAKTELPLDSDALEHAKRAVIRAAALLRADALPASPDPARCAGCAVRAVCAHRAPLTGSSS